LYSVAAMLLRVTVSFNSQKFSIISDHYFSWCNIICHWVSESSHRTNRL